jgi:kynurenine formamidase
MLAGEGQSLAGDCPDSFEPPEARNMSRLIDLSQEIYQGMYVYPGHLKTVIWDHHLHEETAKNFEGGFSHRSKGLLMSDHGPTHVDSISHLDPRPDALNIDQMALETFYGSACCLDVSQVPARTDIDASHLDRAVADAGIEVRPGDIVLLYTGTFNRLHGTPEYLSQYPGLGESGSRWMLERRVKAFGVDTPSPDNPASRTYPCHMMCREHGITHYENLANLDQVVGTRFTFIGFPLKVRNGTGSPVRAVAVVDDERAGG